MTPNSDDAPHAVAYRTRWGRASIAMIAGFATVTAMAVSALNGALGSSFVATSARGELAVDGLKTDQVAAIVRNVPTKDFNGQPSSEWVATFLIGHGYANGVCLTEKASMFGQTVTLLLFAGDQDPSTSEIEVNGLTLDVFDANAFLQAQGNTAVNKSPTEIAIPGVPLLAGASPYEFGLEAQSVVLQNATATVLDGGLLELPADISLDARMVMGDVDCPAPG
ncbi:hypothetical protein [Antrihabitans spumae]|uniref:Cholesterol esterase n=1 Tax=Antrihabitans spumae TaxID=3373370 RepID=A0ABW7KU47_9NOCA